MDGPAERKAMDAETRRGRNESKLHWTWGGRPWRGRRRTWMAATFFTLPAVVLGTATVAGAYGVGRFVLEPEPACTPVTVTAPARDSFDIKIFNASGVDGAATTAADQLRSRGFRVSETANQPGLGSSRLEILHGRTGLDAALLLAQQIPGSQVRDDGRAGTGLSVVLGHEYRGLVAVPPPPPPRPENVTVNVYNSTWRPGLAGTIADDLRTRSFRIGRNGNDPRHAYLPTQSAVIRYGKGGEAAAKVLAQHVPGATLTKIDRDDDTTVDLVAGNGYSALTPAAQVPPPPPEPAAPATAPTVTRPCS